MVGQGPIDMPLSTTDEKATMRPSFPRLLRQFMRSVDIVDDELRAEVLKRLGDYLARDPNVNYAEIMRVVTSQDKDTLALRTEWRMLNKEVVLSDEYAAASLSDIDSGSGGTNALHAVRRNRPMWMLDPNRGLLGVDAVNRWPGQSSGSLGVYKRPDLVGSSNIGPFRTSIIHPLRYNDFIVGALDLESANHLEPVASARREVSILADALGTLLGMRRAADHPKVLRGNALRDLAIEASQIKGLALTKPRLFFAWPEAPEDRHCKQVVSTIRGVLDEYEDHVEISDWSDKRMPGSVMNQLTQDIRSSAYAICYFSEPDPKATGRYVDNANVLFEAGMLHALVGDEGGWILVREEDSRCDDPPFDLSGLRRIEVPRTQQGVLDESRLVDRLHRTIREVVIGVS